MLVAHAKVGKEVETAQGFSESRRVFASCVMTFVTNKDDVLKHKNHKP